MTDINRTFALQIIKSNPYTAAIFHDMRRALIDLSDASEVYQQSHMQDCDCEFCRAISRADVVVAEVGSEL